MTMPCVAHETGFASKLADRVIVMDRGKLVEEANPEAFLKRAGKCAVETVSCAGSAPLTLTTHHPPHTSRQGFRCPVPRSADGNSCRFPVAAPILNLKL